MPCDVVNVCHDALGAAAHQLLPGVTSERVRECCDDFGRVKQSSVAKDLMHISPMTLSNLVCHMSPPALVDLGEMGLVLGIHNPDGVAACDDDVGNEMSQRAVAR